VSASHQDTVGPFAQGLENKLRIDAPRAHHPDNPGVWRVLEPGYTRQVRPTVTTPVTQKADDFRFKFCFYHSRPFFLEEFEDMRVQSAILSAFSSHLQHLRIKITSQGYLYNPHTVIKTNLS
jgi:hypothetical protein